MIARLLLALSLLPLLVRALRGCDREQMRMRIMGLVDTVRLPPAKYIETDEELVLVQDEDALNEAKESEYKRLVKAAENHRDVGKYRARQALPPTQKPLGQCRLCYVTCSPDTNLCSDCMASTQTQRYVPRRQSS